MIFIPDNLGKATLGRSRRKIIFRVDGNEFLGLGHIMRCLSIADCFANIYDYDCLFITSGGEFEKVITSHDHKNMVLNTRYDQMEQELDLLISIFQNVEFEFFDALFIDSYYVTEKYLKQLWKYCRQHSAKLVYIDDILAFPYPCDILINYNIYGSYLDYRALFKCEKSPEMLIGTLYTPLRTEFQSMAFRNICERGKHVLISTGGADFEHIAISLVRKILTRQDGSGNLKDITFHFIIGTMNRDADKIRELAGKSPHIVLDFNVRNMATLMRKSDVAISAAGSTLYELCATQTPTITYILADNQIPGAEGFERHKILSNVGDVRELGVSLLSNMLIDETLELLKNYNERKKIASKMSRIVDGRGAERIAKAIRRV